LFKYSTQTCFTFLLLGWFFQSCAPSIPKQAKQYETTPIITVAENQESVHILYPGPINQNNQALVDNALKNALGGYILNNVHESIKDDSLTLLIVNFVHSKIPENTRFYAISNFSFYNDTVKIEYELNADLIDHFVAPVLEQFGFPGEKPIYPLFTQSHEPPTVEAIKNLKLLMPCKNAELPKQALLLPNAPRTYRNGIHRGIDFFVNWGTPVRAVAEGIVIRADHHFKEVEPEFRKLLLTEAQQLGHTPSDVFEHVLVGQAVYIDHGFDLVPGYRAVSIYAHLSHINPEIKPGVTVTVSQQIGLSGNSGTEPSTLGTRKGAHLHWELILQDAGGEYYLGQGVKSDSLYIFLKNIFKYRN